MAGLEENLASLLGIVPGGGPTNIDPLAQGQASQQDQMKKMLAEYLAPPKERNKWAEALFEGGKAMAHSNQGIVGATLEGAQGGFQGIRDSRLQNDAEKRKHTEKLITTALALETQADKASNAEAKLAIAQQGADVAKLRAEMYGNNVNSQIANRTAMQQLAQSKVNDWRRGADERITIARQNAELNKNKEVWDREKDITDELSKLRTSFGDTSFMTPEAKAYIETQIEAERVRLRAIQQQNAAAVAPSPGVVPNTSVPPETAQPIPTPLDPTKPDTKAKPRIGARKQWQGFVWTYNGVKWVRGDKVQ